MGGRLLDDANFGREKSAENVLGSQGGPVN